MNERPVMTYPITKRINRYLIFNDYRAELYVKKWEPNFLAKLKRVKCWCQDQKEVEMKTIK